MNILELRKVNKSFGKLQALSDINFELKQGEIFGLAGPNGSGKTTLFNVITGITHGSGQILFEGININGLKPYQICYKGIARTFQTPTVFSTLTIYQNLQVGAHFGKLGKHNEGQAIERALDFVGLCGKENVLAGSLPLFERKMTMMAAALATEPKILLLDEPLGGLSPTEIEKSLKIIRKQNDELGMTIIVIEHLMRELVGLCERLMILHYGDTICLGSSQEVVKNNKVIEVYLGKANA